ncbi:hypothetical protein GCM10007887_38200 [Methylobacterium haplocladii]|uniref:Uncharacterized protein n=1 Tax=Methylobacterium haplocladii TaxID=1176176 RepID=A0A512IL96_9HYPH|nr:hypothetical protein MHA02_08690 [Methylobacterium haplocladii]GLS61125.1 hypothetical protein GCM10007887_38200 [Methylobacterium haplocladii]
MRRGAGVLAGVGLGRGGGDQGESEEGSGLKAHGRDLVNRFRAIAECSIGSVNKPLPATLIVGRSAGSFSNRSPFWGSGCRRPRPSPTRHSRVGQWGGTVAGTMEPETGPSRKRPRHNGIGAQSGAGGAGQGGSERDGL